MPTPRGTNVTHSVIPTSSASLTRTMTRGVSPSHTSTGTSARTPSSTPSMTASLTSTQSATSSQTPTGTSTASATPTGTTSAMPTRSRTVTTTTTPSCSSTATRTPSQTRTSSASLSSSGTSTQTPTSPPGAFPWPQEAYGPSLGAASAFGGPNGSTVALLWRTNVGANITSFVAASDRGIVVMAAYAGLDAQVVALDALSGNIEWRASAGMHQGCLMFDGAGNVVITGQARLTDFFPLGRIALLAGGDGATLYSSSMPGSGISCPTLAADGDTVAWSGSDSGNVFVDTTQLTALYASTVGIHYPLRPVRWGAAPGNFYNSGSPPAVPAIGSPVLGRCSGTSSVSRLLGNANSGGWLLSWNSSSPPDGWGCPSLWAVDDASGVVFVATVGGYILSINQSGTVVWNVSLGGSVLGLALVGSGIASSPVARIVVVANNTLGAFNASSGSSLWWHAGCLVQSAPALDSRGVIYAGVGNGGVAAWRSSDGAVLWAVQVATSSESQGVIVRPTIGIDVIYVVVGSEIIALTAPTNGQTSLLDLSLVLLPQCCACIAAAVSTAPVVTSLLSLSSAIVALASCVACCCCCLIALAVLQNRRRAPGVRLPPSNNTPVVLVPRHNPLASLQGNAFVRVAIAQAASVPFGDSSCDKALQAIIGEQLQATSGSPTAVPVAAVPTRVTRPPKSAPAPPPARCNRPISAGVVDPARIAANLVDSLDVTFSYVNPIASVSSSGAATQPRAAGSVATLSGAVKRSRSASSHGSFKTLSWQHRHAVDQPSVEKLEYRWYGGQRVAIKPR